MTDEQENPKGYKVRDRRKDDDEPAEAAAQMLAAVVETPPTTDTQCHNCPHSKHHHDDKGCYTGRATEAACPCRVKQKHIGIEPLAAYARRGHAKAIVFGWVCPNPQCGKEVQLPGWAAKTEVEVLANGGSITGECNNCGALVRVTERRLQQAVGALPGVPPGVPRNRDERRAAAARGRR